MASTIKPNQRTTSGRTSKQEAAETAASRIKSVKEVNKWAKFCIYGRNKSGKTHFAGSSNRKTLIVDCQEKGTETLITFPNNIDVYELERWEELEWMYWHLKSNKHDYEVVAVDTVTMLSNLCLAWVLGAESRDVSQDPLMPDRRHYGKLGMALNQALINWRNLPMHVLFLAQERVETVEDEESTDGTSTLSEVVPSLTRGPRSTLMSAVGTIGRIYTRQVEKRNKETNKTVEVTERRLLVGSHARFAAGTRIKGLPRVIVNPSLEQLLVHREKFGEIPMDSILASPTTAEEL